MAKTFTLNQAQMLIPVLEALMERAQRAVTRGAELEVQMDSLSRRIFLAGGMHVDVASAARRRAERERAEHEATTTVAEMEEMGTRVHDLNSGLVDLPFQVEGRTVMLCWQAGEPTIEHWHEEGAEGEERRPLDGRFGREPRERLH